MRHSFYLHTWGIDTRAALLLENDLSRPPNSKAMHWQKEKQGDKQTKRRERACSQGFGPWCLYIMCGCCGAAADTCGVAWPLELRVARLSSWRAHRRIPRGSLCACILTLSLALQR
jgi:hypothetical protein